VRVPFVLSVEVVEMVMAGVVAGEDEQSSSSLTATNICRSLDGSLGANDFLYVDILGRLAVLKRAETDEAEAAFTSRREGFSIVTGLFFAGMGCTALATAWP
jgi:hypothetical protein